MSGRVIFDRFRALVSETASPHCIVSLAASISIFADLPQPSELMHVSVSGLSNLNLDAFVRPRANLFDAAVAAVDRDRALAARVEGDQVKQSLEFAAIDKVGDQLGGASSIVRPHAAILTRCSSHDAARPFLFFGAARPFPACAPRRCLECD